MPQRAARLLVFLPERTGVRRTVRRALREAEDWTRAEDGKVAVDFLAASGIERVVREEIDAARESHDDRLTVRLTATAFDTDGPFDSLRPPTGTETVRVIVGPGPSATVDAVLAGASDRGWAAERVERDSRRRLLVRDGELPRAVATAAVAFVFYLSLGRLTAFDVLTGAVSAGLVAVVLSEVAFADGVSARRTGGRFLRSVPYLPYLLWEIARANLHVAAVILDPRLPIDPAIERVGTRTQTDLERAVLANSITLTPGTLTVAVRGESFHVHSLTTASRASLERGAIERAVRFVFHGRGEDGERPEQSGNPERDGGD